MNINVRFAKGYGHAGWSYSGDVVPREGETLSLRDTAKCVHELVVLEVNHLIVAGGMGGVVGSPVRLSVITVIVKYKNGG